MFNIIINKGNLILENLINNFIIHKPIFYLRNNNTYNITKINK